MRLAKSLTNRDMQITFTFLNTLWKSEKGRMRKEHMNIKKEGKKSEKSVKITIETR